MNKQEPSDELVFSMDDFCDENTGDVMVGGTPFGEGSSPAGPENELDHSDASCYTDTCTYAECCDRGDEPQAQSA